MKPGVAAYLTVALRPGEALAWERQPGMAHERDSLDNGWVEGRGGSRGQNPCGGLPRCRGPRVAPAPFPVQLQPSELREGRCSRPVGLIRQRQAARTGRPPGWPLSGLLAGQSKLEPFTPTYMHYYLL
ncbi:hypothetical protein NDU88_005011 [Pleurodeles waltl]|uniref:Uncharacterized protein n=1 Tax=Pleurodeles waltl TaxID=8319 RepID=A0AAV7WTJ5_PLEWA|nr:hypothetical protein NDU88_005011 [Pleurodeles waltl]